MKKTVRIDVRTDGGGVQGRRFVMDSDSPRGRDAAIGELRAWVAENLPELTLGCTRADQADIEPEPAGTPGPEPAATFREAGLALAAKVAHDGKFYMSPAEADIVRTGMVLEWIDGSGNGEVKAEARDEAGRTLAERTVAVGEKEFDRLVDLLFGPKDGEDDGE